MRLEEHGATAEAPAWLPLLQRLTAACPVWGVWKNADAALKGMGDVDSVAPIEYWPLIHREFNRWAQAHQLGPVLSCRHLPGSLLLVACDRRWERLLELHVVARASFRLGPAFVAESLVSMMEQDSRGFRRLRPGAEGLLLLMYNGTKRGGRRDREGLRAKRVVELLRCDPEGIEVAARLFGSAEQAALSGASAVAAERWERWAMLRVELRAASTAMKEPGALASKLGFRLVARRRCPLQAALRAKRRLPRDGEEWLRRVARTHRIDERPAAGSS